MKRINTAASPGGRFAAALLAAWLLTVAPPALAGRLEEAVARLEATVVDQLKPGPTPRLDNKAATLATLLGRLHAAIDTGRWQDAVHQVNHFAEQEKSPEVLEIFREVRVELLNKIANHEQEQITRIDAAIARGAGLCLTAQGAAELDEVLRELATLRPGIDNFHPEPLRSAYTRLDGALHFIGRWQDSLAKAATGDTQAAAAPIAELLEKSKTQLVPRSAMLARLAQLRAPGVSPGAASAPGALFITPVSIDAIEALHSHIERRVAAAPDDKNARTLLHQISALRSGYAELQSGRYGAALQHSLPGGGGAGAVAEEIVELQQQLVIAVLPHYLATEERLERRPGERASDVLLRHLRQARDKQDWTGALRAAEALRLVGFYGSTPPRWLEADIAGYSAIVVAAHHEVAGFWTEAIASYQAALRETGENLPVAWLSDRVKALRERHPASARSAAPRAR